MVLFSEVFLLKSVGNLQQQQKIILISSCIDSQKNGWIFCRISGLRLWNIFWVNLIFSERKQMFIWVFGRFFFSFVQPPTPPQIYSWLAVINWNISKKARAIIKKRTTRLSFFLRTVSFMYASPLDYMLTVTPWINRHFHLPITILQVYFTEIWY